MKLVVRAHDILPNGSYFSGAEQLVGKLQDLGLDGVQLVAYKAFEDIKYLPGNITKNKAKQIGEAFSSNDLTIPLIGAYFNPVHSNVAKIEGSKEIFNDYLRLAGDFGANTVGSETGSFNDDKWTYHPSNRTDEALNIVTKCFTSLADSAAGYGANIAVEGAAGHVCYDVDRLSELIQKIERSNVKVIFDLYNYLDDDNHEQCYEILQKGLKTFKDILCFHIKDYVLEGGKVKQCPVGQGRFDFDRIVDMIFSYNTAPVLVFEGTTGDNLPRSLDFLRQKIIKRG